MYKLHFELKLILGVKTNTKRRYHGYVNDLEILNYNTTITNNIFNKFIKEHKYNKNLQLEITLKSKQKYFMLKYIFK